MFSGAYPELVPQTVVNVANGKRRHNSTSEDALQAVTATLAAGEGATAGTKRLSIQRGQLGSGRELQTQDPGVWDTVGLANISPQRSWVNGANA